MPTGCWAEVSAGVLGSHRRIGDTGAVTATVDAEPAARAGRRPKPVRRALAWVLALGLALVLVVPLLAVALVVATSRDDDRTPTDVVVVLGASQFNGRPSPVLEARLRHARDLLGDGVAPRIVTVGGNQPGDVTTEAQAGKQWLVDSGAPSSAVTAVPTGHDTLQSLTAVAGLMRSHGWSSATIVTDPAHLARSLAMARALGIRAHGSATSEGAGSSLTLDYVGRETLGLLWFWAAERRDVPQVVPA